MGIDATFVSLMERFGAKGLGASLGYPHYVRHELPKNKRRGPSEPVFAKMGLDIDFYDAGKRRGDEIVMDLDEPLTLDIRGKYDFLIDPGTIGHCFNTPNVLKIGLQIVKPGGLFFHHGCMERNIHGFWNPTPRTLKDFYMANGKFLFWKQVDWKFYAVARRGQSDEVQWPKQNNVR